jgi:hypothetical protein
MENKDKVKILRKFADLCILCEENKLMVSFNYFTSSAGISFTVTGEKYGEPLIQARVYLDVFSFEKADQIFNETMQECITHFRHPIL